MSEILKAVSNYGFPMVVAIYLLIRFETKLDSLATCITELNQSIKSFLEDYMKYARRS